MKHYWQTYKETVERLFGPLTLKDGIPEEDIIEVEKHLGFRFPQVLRDFYLLAGERSDLNDSHDHLIDYDELVVEGNTLVFYADNQGVVFWGIPINTSLFKNNGPRQTTTKMPTKALKNQRQKRVPKAKIAIE